jgi:hypothetical protein
MLTQQSRISSFSTLLYLMVLISLFPSINNAQSQASSHTDSDDLYWIIENGKFGFIDSKGVVVIKPQFLMVYPYFSEGLAAVLIGNEQKEKTAFIDTKGRIVFETHDSPSEKGFSSGVAVLLADQSSDHYYVNKKGKRVTGNYNQAEDCSEGLCAVKMQSMGRRHFGYINTSGETVIKGQFDRAYPFSAGAARVCVIPDDTNEDDIAPPARRCKIGFIDRSGTPITDIIFDGARDFSEDMAQVKSGDKWGYIDRSGAVIIPPQYEETSPFKNGLARVKLNSFWGFIDKSGRMVISARFEFADDFYEDLASVRLQACATCFASVFYIDRTGRKVLTPPFERLGRFRNGVAVVGVNNKYGLINKEGQVIVSPHFKDIEMVSDELIRVTDAKKGIGYMNYSGEFVWKPIH